MKKIYMLFLLVFFGLNLFSQAVYMETFSAGIPSDYKLYKQDGLSTEVSTIAQGKGAWFGYNGLALSTSYFNPSASADRWMVTKGIAVPNLTNMDNKMLLVWYEANADDAYPDGYEVRVGTVDQAIANLSTVVLTVAPSETVSAGRFRSIDLSSYAGQTVYVAFRNNTFDGTFLILDNITLVETGRYDMIATDITNVMYNPTGVIQISGRFSNLGHETVSNFDFNYSIDGGAVQTGSTATFISTFDEVDAVSSIPYTGTKGLHTLAIWPTNINGQPLQASIENDTAFLPFFVYDATDQKPRTSISEMFSSSTCGPCKAGWEKYESLLGTKPNKPIQMKIQQDFPGTGDPYTTGETVARRNFYEVNAIPALIVDGNFLNTNPGSLTNANQVLNGALRPGLVTWDLKYELDTSAHSIHLWGSVKPEVVLLPTCRAQIGIFEKKTTKNKKTNGETQFINVLKKFLPDQEGYNLTGAPEDEEIEIDLVYTFPGNYRLPLDGTAANRIKLDTEHSVEEFVDLAAHAWIECARDKYVLNATTAKLSTGTNHISAITSISIAPNPAHNVATAILNLNNDLTGDVILSDVQGRVVWNAKNQNFVTGANTLQLPIQGLAGGVYNLVFRSGNKIASTELIIQ